MSFKIWSMGQSGLKVLKHKNFLNLFQLRREVLKLQEGQALKNFKMTRLILSILTLERYSLILLISKTKKPKMFFMVQL